MHQMQPIINHEQKANLTYTQRAKEAYHPLTKKLFVIMEEKQTNIIFSADLATKKEFLEKIDAVGPYICAVKTHIEIIENFDWDLIEQLLELKKKHNFLIIQDSKVSDIGNTAYMQTHGGMYRIFDWADVVIAQTISGAGVIQGLKKDTDISKRGILLVAQMSCAENLITPEYTEKTIELGEKNKDFVIGFISQGKCSNNPGMIHLTPGVNLNTKKDKLGQQFNSPEYLLKECKTDILIVGRGIYQAEDSVAAVKKYKEIAWKAYIERTLRQSQGERVEKRISS